MKIVIRNANETDIGKLIVIWKRVGFYYESWDNNDRLSEKIKLQPELFKIAQIDGKTVGGVIGTYDGWASYINHLAVDPDLPNRDIILKNLLKDIQNEFKKKNVKNVFVFTFPNHEENKFFMENGFRNWGKSNGLSKDLD